MDLHEKRYVSLVNRNFLFTFLSEGGKHVGEHLNGAWFEGQPTIKLSAEAIRKDDLPVFAAAKQWLQDYTDGNKPACLPVLEPFGSAFQKEVWELLLKIPYGRVTTYREMALCIARHHHYRRECPQSIGNALKHNPISIFIPCHRVIGSDASLVGYAGGIEKKRLLLCHEQADLSHPVSLTAEK